MLVDVLDALRRIISRWVETVTPITFDVIAGDTIISVDSTNRFASGDEVMIEAPEQSETGLIIDEIIDDKTITLITPTQNSWDTSENIVLRKLKNGLYIQGIYIGNPEVIPQYPAITVSGRSIDSEWMTLDSTKEHYEVEIAIHVEQSTHEEGYRYLLNLQDIVKTGLKRNIYPLVGDYETTAVDAPIVQGDNYIHVVDASIFNTPLTDTTGSYPRLSDARVIIENSYQSEETRVQRIIADDVVEIAPKACRSYSLDDNPILIRPTRFIYNSWPRSISIGTTDKQGTLLQTSVIRWFADEEELVDFKNNDPHLK